MINRCYKSVAMKNLLAILMILTAVSVFGQDNDPEKKGLNIKKPNIKKPEINLKKPELRIGEKVGKLTGNLMTQKTSDLSTTAPMVSLVCGAYDRRASTSETRFWPKSVQDGDFCAAVTFFKGSGVGLNQIDGTVSCNGQEMEYVSMGSYMLEVPQGAGSHKISVTTSTGDQAEYTLQTVEPIDIISINGDALFPIIDLAEDLTIQVSHSPESEGMTVKVGLVSDIMGASAVNYFADFKSTADEVTIPKEALSNPEIAGAFNIGQMNRGNTFLVVERVVKTEPSQVTASQCSGSACGTSTLQSLAYGSMAVVVKGKQEEGIITEVRFSGKNRKVMGFDAYKPNANSGIPFSRASKFGLASLSLEGSTFKQEQKKGSSSYSVGGTRYTSTWVQTTTYQFPQLPDAYWDQVLEEVYQRMSTILQTDFSIPMAPVESVTSTSAYADLFRDDEVNTPEVVARSYKNTQRTEPGSFRELMATISSTKTTETSANLIMQQAGVDGLVSIKLSFVVGGDKDKNVVLIPKLTFSMQGMDETKNNKNGTYAEGHITFQQGIPFNSERVQSDPAYLVEILNIEGLMSTMQYMLVNLQQKEQALGYDKIWSIGE